MWRRGSCVASRRDDFGMSVLAFVLCALSVLSVERLR